MDHRLSLTLAGRIDAALLRELGQGIDLARMLAEPLYARDVLLVCEAIGQGELAQLAREFRAALNADAPPEPAGPDSVPGGAEDSRSGPVRFLSSVFGAFGGPEGPVAAASKGRQRGWFARGR